MGWYKIENYSSIRYVNLNSDTMKTTGLCFILADEQPFCISISFERREREYRLLKNDFCLMLPQTSYRIYTDPDVETRIITLELGVDNLSENYHSIFALCTAHSEVKKLIGAQARHTVGCGSKTFRELVLLIQSTHEASAKTGTSSAVCQHLIAALITQAAEDIYGSGSTSVLCVHTKKALSYISKNYQKNISVSSLSEHIGISTRRLQTLFKEELGSTVSDYLRSFRISSACDMLRSTALPINDIANTVGCNSRQHFAAAFKAVCGMSPQEFRQNSKKRNYRFTSDDGHSVGFLSFLSTKSDLDIDGKNSKYWYSTKKA